MFIGHFAPAFVATAFIAKKQTNSDLARNSAWLGVMFVAAQLVDFGFFAFVLTDIEHMRITPGISAMVPFDLYDMPYTHSLLGSLVWGMGFAGLILALSKNRYAALMGFLVVVSHWFLDVLVHIPDMTVTGGEPKLGFGLWNHPWIEMPLELGILLASFLYYTRCSAPIGKQAGLSAGILLALLLLVQVFNWFGPVPETFTPDLAWSALAAFAILSVAAHWTARQRIA